MPCNRPEDAQPLQMPCCKPVERGGHCQVSRICFLVLDDDCADMASCRCWHTWSPWGSRDRRLHLRPSRKVTTVFVTRLGLDMIDVLQCGEFDAGLHRGGRRGRVSAMPGVFERAEAWSRQFHRS